MNFWRIQRLLLLKIKVKSVEILSHMPLRQGATSEASAGATTLSVADVDCIQALVDDVCYSVPFYLGNRTGVSRLSDFTDPETLFPSYHSLALGDARVREWHVSNPAMPSLDEHQRQLIAQGAWHAMSPLSSLLALFSEEGGGRFVASCLRPRQQQWIRDQFMRVSVLLRLPIAESRVPATSTPDWEKERSPSPSPVPPSLESPADHLSQQVRKGAVFMSGP